MSPRSVIINMSESTGFVSRCVGGLQRKQNGIVSGWRRFAVTIDCVLAFVGQSMLTEASIWLLISFNEKRIFHYE